MSLRIQIIIGVATLIFFLYIINMVRIRRVELKYALIWYLICIVLLLLDIFPETLDWLTAVLGIDMPIHMLFFLGIAFILLFLYAVTLVITNENRRTKRLIQEVGLLNHRVKELEQILKEAGYDVKAPVTHSADAGPEHEIYVSGKEEK